MSARRPSIMILFLVLQLLLGQQLALAHKFGHLGEHHREKIVSSGSYTSPSVAVIATDDDSHDAPHALADVCTTCLAVLALDVWVCPVHEDSRASSAAEFHLTVAVSPAPTFLRHLPFRSRAPPPLLS